MLVEMEKRFVEWVKEHQADDGSSDVMFLRKACVAGTNDEREECAKVNDDRADSAQRRATALAKVGGTLREQEATAVLAIHFAFVDAAALIRARSKA